MNLVSLALLAATCAAVAFGQETATAAKDERTIPGVPELKWGLGNQCTFIGALRAALHSTGDSISYNDLMGVSGAAFRLCFAQPQWDFSSVDGMLSYDHASVAMKALGYPQAIIAGGGNPNEPDAAEARRQIVSSIDAGRPAVGIDLVIAPEWAVIAGYEQGGRVWICRSYFDNEPQVDRRADGLVRSERWPWIRVIPGPKGKPLAPREALLEAIRVATTFAGEEDYITSGGGGRYARGLTAYRAWANDLRDEDRFRDEGEARRNWQVNSFCFEALLDARIAAAEYLEKRVALLEGADRDRLARAAAGYRSIADILRAHGEKCVPRFKPDAALASWTQDLRDDQAELLTQCAGREKQAIAELRAVIDE